MMRQALSCVPFVVVAACAKTAEMNGDLLSSRAPTVAVDAGKLSGAIDTATGILVFRGIPYAAPPVGDRRWRAPAPLAHWSGVRAADHLGKNCVQGQVYSDIDPFAAGVSEDCLFLNVWTAGLDAGAKRPVLVWIHGGGYTAGFGGEERHNGARLAQKGAVVVTLNYRLGASDFSPIRRSPSQSASRRATMGFWIRSPRCNG